MYTRGAFAIATALGVAASAVIVTTSGPATAAASWAAWASSPTDDSVRLTSANQSTRQPTIATSIDPTVTFQTWRGVGASLTDSSVELLATGAIDSAALDLLFDPAAGGGARLNLLRLPLSATDFSSEAWTWEWNRRRGTASPTSQALEAIDTVNQITRVRDDLEVTATAWTAPPSMKTNRDDIGGALRSNKASTYAAMLAAQARTLIDLGVPLRGMTIGNEPGYAGNYPSMTVSDRTMARIADQLGPDLDDLGVDLYALDHNWADRDRAEGQLSRSDAFDGVAFHCYGGSPDQMDGFDVPVMITECTGTTDAWYSTFGWDARELVVNAALAGSTGLMMWNLALDPQHGPKADWGCTDCRGLVTIDPANGSIEPTPEFYTVAHVARAAEPGAVRIDATPIAGVPLVAFQNPDGTLGLFAQNDTHVPQTIQIDVAGDSAHSVDIGVGEMLTVRWSPTAG